MTLNEKQKELCERSEWDFSDLKALFLNCTLKPSPRMSHTRGLIEISAAIMQKNGVDVEILRPVDYSVAYGVWPDMTERGTPTTTGSAGASSRATRTAPSTAP